MQRRRGEAAAERGGVFLVRRGGGRRAPQAVGGALLFSPPRPLGAVRACLGLALLSFAVVLVAAWRVGRRSRQGCITARSTMNCTRRHRRTPALPPPTLARTARNQETRVFRKLAIDSAARRRARAAGHPASRGGAIDLFFFVAHAASNTPRRRARARHRTGRSDQYAQYNWSRYRSERGRRVGG